MKPIKAPPAASATEPSKVPNGAHPAPPASSSVSPSVSLFNYATQSAPSSDWISLLRMRLMASLTSLYSAGPTSPPIPHWPHAVSIPLPHAASPGTTSRQSQCHGIQAVRSQRIVSACIDRCARKIPAQELRPGCSSPAWSCCCCPRPLRLNSDESPPRSRPRPPAKPICPSSTLRTHVLAVLKPRRPSRPTTRSGLRARPDLRVHHRPALRLSAPVLHRPLLGRVPPESRREIGRQGRTAQSEVGRQVYDGE